MEILTVWYIFRIDILLLQVVLASDKNLYFITLDYLLSSTISVRNTWTIITSSTFALSSTFISLSVGVTVVLASDEDGNLYSFSVQPSSDSPYSLISVFFLCFLKVIVACFFRKR